MVIFFDFLFFTLFSLGAFGVLTVCSGVAVGVTLGSTVGLLVGSPDGVAVTSLNDEELAAAGDNSEDYVKKETLERLASALLTLKREERDIVVLRYYKGLSLTQISRRTGISYGMVKVRHKKALSALRVQLGAEDI